MANLINLEKVSKAYGIRPLLSEVSLGISVGERIGIVGRNGDGKTTLLEVMTGLEEPDAGRVSMNRGVEIGYLHQGDELVDTHSVREAVLGGRADHEWLADCDHARRRLRAAGRHLARPTGPRPVRWRASPLLAGRAAARRARADRPRRAHQPPRRRGRRLARAATSSQRSSALVVVTHDRWFLDEVCQTTWEVHDGVVDSYEGGYASFVLAKAERQRQAGASEQRRQQLVKKELAWLRRGAPARTAKPKFRIEAANQLIEDVPPAARPAGAPAVRRPAARQGRHRRRARRPVPRRAPAADRRHLAPRPR